MHSSEEQFIQVLKEHQGIIRKVAYSYCRNAEDQNDLMQEITIQLWRSWNNYNAQFKHSTWIYRIALNVAISFYRKTYRRTDLDRNLNEHFHPVDDNESLTLSENVQHLYHYIAQLDELNKAIILLYLDQYSYEDIASTIGITKTNVATKISRIKKHLQEKFK